MSQFNDAADAIRRAAKLLEGFQVAAEALDRVGSFDNAAKDATKARDKAYKEAEAAKAELNATVTKLESTKAECAKAIEDAGVKGQSIIDAAKANADKAANDILASANAKAEQVIGAAGETLKNLQAKHSEMLGAIDVLVKSHTDMQADVVAKQKQLDSLNAALDKLKAKLGD